MSRRYNLLLAKTFSIHDCMSLTSTGLIDFSALPDGLISGLEEDEIEEIIDIQQLLAQNPTFFDDVPCSTYNNAISSEIKGKLDTLQSSSIPHTTATHQKRYSDKFMRFLEDKNLSTDFVNLATSEIAEYLRFFYSELRTNDGKLYSPATLICIRAALFRFMKQPPLNLPFNIIDDKEFYNANQVLKAMVKNTKKKVEHQSISMQSRQPTCPHWLRTSIAKILIHSLKKYILALCIIWAHEEGSGFVS